MGSGVPISLVKVLLFSRHLQRMEFHDGDVQIAVHEKTVRDAKPYARFLAAFPASRQQLTPGKPVAIYSIPGTMCYIQYTIYYVLYILHGVLYTMY